MTTGSTVNITFPGPSSGLRSVTNLDELRRVLSIDVAHGDNVIVDGSTTTGDGSGGLFVYDMTSTTPDDGKTVIKPIDLGDVSAGRWKAVGQQGSSGGNNDASQVAYGGEYATVREALDALLYVAPQITSFTATPAIVEMGTTVPNVALAWTLNKVVATQTLPGLPLTADARSFTIPGPISADRSWTLAVNDGKSSVTASASLAFRQKRYFGVSANPTLANQDILSLTSEFATGKAKSLTYDCSGGRYPFYAYPAAWGAPSATVSSLSFSDLLVSTVSFTNTSGYTSNYNVVRFGNLQNGSAIAVQWS